MDIRRARHHSGGGCSPTHGAERAGLRASLGQDGRATEAVTCLLAGSPTPCGRDGSAGRHHSSSQPGYPVMGAQAGQDTNAGALVGSRAAPVAHIAVQAVSVMSQPARTFTLEQARTVAVL